MDLSKTREEVTSARIQAVTPVPHEATIGFSKDMPETQNKPSAVAAKQLRF